MRKNKIKAIVTLSFDDCYQDTLVNVLPLLKKYKLKASFNVAVGLINKKLDGLKLADWADLHQANKFGAEICSHSITHTSLVDNNKLQKFIRSFPYRHNKLRFIFEGIKDTFSPQKMGHLSNVLVENEVGQSKDLLDQRGFQVSSFVYPNGYYNHKLKLLVKKYYSSARSTDAGFNNLSHLNLYALKIFPWDRWTKIATANQWVNKAIKQKLWLIESFHLVAAANKNNYRYFTSTEDFEKHLQYLQTKNIPVVPQNEVIEFLKKEL